MKRTDVFWKLAYLLAAVAVFMIDQTTKAWAVRKLRFGGDMNIIDGFLNFVYAENTGVAFSMLDNNGDAGRWGLATIATIAAVLVLFYFWRIPRTNDRLLGSLALLLAGIVGNLTDRIRLGFVVDFIQVHYRDWYYPVFNVADIAICVGAGLLILDMFWTKKEETKDKEAIQNPKS
jgi:signal peptidase II